MEENEDFGLNEEINDVVAKIDSVLDGKAQYYFDLNEYERVIDYHIEAGSFEKASKIVDLAKKQHPGSAEMLIREAHILALNSSNQKDIDNCFQLLDKAESIDPSNPDVYLTRGFVHRQLSQYEKAIDNYKKAVIYSD